VVADDDATIRTVDAPAAPTPGAGGCAIGAISAHRDQQHPGSRHYPRLRSMIAKDFILT
jgi:hypothetical protein